MVELTDSQIDKADIASSFGRAAASYDGAAQLQRDIGESLLQRHGKLLTERNRLVDLGCGTGYFSARLAEQHAGAEVVAVDLSEGMLQFARGQQSQTNIHWLCGDAEALSLADNSIEGLFSSLAIQWCRDLPALFAEIHRVLAPGGVAMLATLGPETLRELRAAWQQVDNHVHVNQFDPESALRNALPQGLSCEHWHEYFEVLQYSQLSGLTRELKAIGAHNLNSGRAQGLTGRARMLAFKQAYEQFRTENGLLPASYQVFQLLLVKSA